MSIAGNVPHNITVVESSHSDTGWPNLCLGNQRFNTSHFSNPLQHTPYGFNIFWGSSIQHLDLTFPLEGNSFRCPCPSCPPGNRRRASTYRYKVWNGSYYK